MADENSCRFKERGNIKKKTRELGCIQGLFVLPACRISNFSDSFHFHLVRVLRLPLLFLITWQHHLFTATLISSYLSHPAHLTSSPDLKVFKWPIFIRLLSAHLVCGVVFPHFLVFLNFYHPNLNLKLDQTFPCYLCQYLPGSISLPMNHCKHPASSCVCIWVLSQVSARRLARACFTKTI